MFYLEILIPLIAFIIPIIFICKAFKSHNKIIDKMVSGELPQEFPEELPEELPEDEIMGSIISNVKNNLKGNEPKYCAYCDTQINEGDTKCAGCGAKVNKK